MERGDESTTAGRTYDRSSLTKPSPSWALFFTVDPGTWVYHGPQLRRPPSLPEGVVRGRGAANLNLGTVTFYE